VYLEEALHRQPTGVMVAVEPSGSEPSRLPAPSGVILTSFIISRGLATPFVPSPFGCGPKGRAMTGLPDNG